MNGLTPSYQDINADRKQHGINAYVAIRLEWIRNNNNAYHRETIPTGNLKMSDAEGRVQTTADVPGERRYRVLKYSGKEGISVAPKIHWGLTRQERNLLQRKTSWRL
jgi:hypothetical protein